jgi:tetratricopeptide (TPR) repeat protein
VVLLALVVVLLAGCALAPTTPGGAGSKQAAADVTENAADSPPVKEFTEESLYKLLVAEFALRRGQVPLAIDNYLDVARAQRDAGSAERAIRLAVFARDETRGLEAARVWVALAPDDPDARQVYGALLMRAGRTEEAVEQLEIVVAADEGDGEVFLSIGEMLGRERDREAGLRVMGRLVSGHETNAKALLAYAHLAARADDYEKAAQLLEKFLSIHPHDDRALSFYARVLQQKGDSAKALAVLSKALERNPDAGDVRLTYARLLVDMRRYDEALTQFQMLAEQSPDDADVHYALGLLLLQTNRAEEAKLQFLELLRLGQRTDAARYYLGQIAENADQTDTAIREYKRVARGEHYLNAQIRAAVLLAENGDINTARSHLHALPQPSAQQAVRIYRAEAEILSRVDDLQGAMAVYDRALVEHEGNQDLLYARAMLAERLDRIDILEADLNSILSKDPDNADALNALGFTLADRTDRYEEALVLIERAISIKPDDFYIVDSMGWVLYRLGRYEESLTYLQRALVLSNDPEVAAHLGEVLWVMGKRDAAREVWDTALQTTPEDQRLLEVIKRFSN